MPIPETEQLTLRLNEDLHKTVRWERDGEQLILTAGTLTIRETEESEEPVLVVEGEAVDGEIVLHASAATLSTLETPPTTGVYDVVVTDEDDAVSVVLEGPVVIRPGVTRG